MKEGERGFDYYFGRDIMECQYAKKGVLRLDQAAAIGYVFMGPREPKGVLSIGCGIGVVEGALSDLTTRAQVSGIDPSEYAHEHYQGAFHFIVGTLKDWTKTAPYFNLDTVLFCQSLEHIPIDEIREHIPKLAAKHVRIIVVNNEDYHPIEAKDWDHITRVDDALFDWIASFGTEIYRRGSHLVVDT